MALEWEMRTNGAEALAFDVAVLAGPNAALPHGSPGSRQGGEAAPFCSSTSARRCAAIDRT